MSQESAPEEPVTEDVTLPVLLRDLAATAPDAVAITVDPDSTLTFGTWERRSQAVALELLARGLERGRRVAVYFGGDEWVDYAVAYLGVLKAGATAVHLNGGMTDEELLRRLDQCDAVGFVHGSEAPRPVLLGDGRWSTPLTGLETGRTGPTGVAPRTDDIADILYTTGTTGLSKAVACPHGNYVFGRGRATMDHIAAVDHMLAPMPLGTSTSQATICFPILSGTPLLLNAPGDPERSAELIERHRLGTVMVPPHAAIQLVNSGAATRHDLSCVETVATASAAFPPAVAEALLAALPQARLATSYTSIEAAPAVVINVFDPASPTALGVPAHGTELKITDDDGAELPRGVVGHIWLRSAAPKRLYLDPELNRVTHVDGWTRLGDLGHVDGSGVLHFFDRAVDAVRTARGLVSTFAVESALYEHPSVREAAAYGVPADDGERVVALVVTGDPGAVADLSARASERVGVPVEVEPVDALPRNFLGKVVKRELRARPAGTPRPATAGDAPKGSERPMSIESALLELLRCPHDTGTPLTAEGEELACSSCGRRYPVVDGVPVLLPVAG